MSDPAPGTVEARLREGRVFDRLCDRFEQELKQGNWPRIEEFLEGIDRPAADGLFRDLLELELDYRTRHGQLLSADEYCERFPNQVASIREVMVRELDVQTSPDAAKDANDTLLEADLVTIFSNVSGDDLCERLEQSGLFEPSELRRIGETLRGLQDCRVALESLVRQGSLTTYQLKRISKPPVEKLTFGDYVLIDEIGAGGMGVVFRARHRLMDRTVALKLISSAAFESREAVNRFSREVRTLAKLNHPNIVMAYDAGEDEGRHFLVMEYVDGCDLHRYVNQCGPLPLVEALGYVKQAAEGLAYAHDQGVIHRDVKPGNLLRDQDGAIKVLDLGLARWDNCGDQSVDVASFESTRTGQFIGSPGFMSPEQIESSRKVDARTDIYGLGCTLWYLVTGETLYGSDSLVETLNAHVRAPIPSLRKRVPAASPQLNELWRSMVAKDANDRPATMQELAIQLGRLLEQLQADSKQQTVASQKQVAVRAGMDDSHRRGWSRKLALGGGAVFLAVAAVIVIVIQHQDGTETKVSISGSPRPEAVHIDRDNDQTRITIPTPSPDRMAGLQNDLETKETANSASQVPAAISMLGVDLDAKDEDRVRVEQQSLIIDALGTRQVVKTPARVADFTFRSTLIRKNADRTTWGAMGIQCPTYVGNYYHFYIDTADVFAFVQGGFDEDGHVKETLLAKRPLSEVDAKKGFFCEFSIIGTRMTAKINDTQVAMLDLPEESKVLNQKVRRVYFHANNVDAEFRNPELIPLGAVNSKE